MTEAAPVIVAIDPVGIATITLNRPERHNAFDDVVIEALIAALDRVEQDQRVRIVVLAANGKSFCAGADLGWMQRMATYSEAENVADAMRLGHLMHTLNSMPKPTLALVQGDAFAGGLGLIACCDIAIAAEEARFCVSEVRLGLIPAVISPYLLAAIGSRAARRYFLTAERFSATEARHIGLVHEVVSTKMLAEFGMRLTATLLENGPQSIAGAKALIAHGTAPPITNATIAYNAHRIAEARASAEAKDGIAAFFERRKPAWHRSR